MPILPANFETIASSAAALRRGALVAFPTETVYGLGGDATNGQAVARIFAAKGRPTFNPLIVHVADASAVAPLVEMNDRARILAEAFWPGPLTMVLPRATSCPVSELATCGLDTIAVRVPSHPVARQLLSAAGVPVAAPSANRSGHVSPTTAQHVADDLGAEVSIILDGGPALVGMESTVVDLSEEAPTLLRPGGVPTADIERLLGLRMSRRLSDDVAPSSPGQLASHYAPHAAVRLNVTNVLPGEALLAFGPVVLDHDGPCRNISAAGDLVEAAANLFAALRDLDSTGVASIAVMPIPENGLGEAINDRLRRAAAPR